MLTQKPTSEMMKEWKKVYQENRSSLKPNRRTGIELDEYLRGKYYVIPINTDKANEVVINNIVCNEPFKEKLPQGVLPKPVTYYVGDRNVFVGIDLISGYFCVEGSEQIYDKLFAFRGLDEKDLDNIYLVAEYVRVTNL